MGSPCLHIISFFLNMQTECANLVSNSPWHSNTHFAEILPIGLAKFASDLVDKGHGLLHKGPLDTETALTQIVLFHRHRSFNHKNNVQIRISGHRYTALSEFFLAIPNYKLSNTSTP